MTTIDQDRQRLETLAFYTVILLLGYLLYRIFEPFLVPLGWAGVLVVCCHPWHDRLTRRWGRTRAAALSTMIVAVAIIAPGLLLGAAFVRETAQAVSEIDRALEAGGFVRLQRAVEWVQRELLGRQPVDIATLARQAAATFGGVLAAQAGTVARNVAVFIFDLGVTLFAAFFLFRDGPAIMRVARRMLPFNARQRELMIAESRDLIAASVTSGLVVAAVQGALGGIVFAALGLAAPVFWGVVMAFFALLPVAGAWLVWGPAAIWLILQGDLTRGVIMIGVGAGIVGMVDNVLRPALLSGRSRLNGLLVCISLLGGVTVFGLLGLVLGPVIVAVAVGLMKAHADAVVADPSDPATAIQG